jgi:transcriptional regulator with XRE-family HTH domain
MSPSQLKVSKRPLPDELPHLLETREMTLRALAREVGGLDHSYLSRMISRKTPVNVHHAERIARRLGLPADFFPEVREAAVVTAVRRSPRLRDAIYFEHVKKPSK